MIINKNKLLQKSIIKPYQGIYIKNKFFMKKVGTINSKITKNINQKIDNNARKYLTIKNNLATKREFIIEENNEIIEKQNQKIIDLELQNEQKNQEITKLKFKTEELKLTKNKLLSQEKDFELE